MEGVPEDADSSVTYRQLFTERVADPFENARTILHAAGKQDELSEAAADLRAEIGLIEYDAKRFRYYRVTYSEDGIRLLHRLYEPDITSLTKRILELY